MHPTAREVHGTSLRSPSCRFKSLQTYFKSYNFLLESIQYLSFFETYSQRFPSAFSLGHFDIKLRLGTARARKQQHFKVKSYRQRTEELVGHHTTHHHFQDAQDGEYPRRHREAKNQSVQADY